MVKYTHKTLRNKTNELYKNPEKYLESLGFVRTSRFGIANIEFVRMNSEPRFTIYVSECKPIDEYTWVQSRFLGFEGNPELVESFISGLEGLILPMDARL